MNLLSIMMILGMPSAFAAFLTALSRFNRGPLSAVTPAPPRNHLGLVNHRAGPLQAPLSQNLQTFPPQSYQLQAPLSQNLQTLPPQSYDTATLNRMAQLAAAQATIDAARKAGASANVNTAPALPVNAANLASATASPIAAIATPNSPAVNVASPQATATKKFSIDELVSLLSVIQAIQQPPVVQQPQTVQQPAAIQQPAAAQPPVVFQQSPNPPNPYDVQITEYLNDLV